MSYAPYPAYKESGVPWLGPVPEEWEVKKLSHAISYTVGFTPESGNAEYYADGDGYDWANISDLGPKWLSKTQKQISEKAVQNFGKKPALKGSLLYSFKLSVGSVSRAAKDMYTNEAIASFLPNRDLSLDYFYYLAPLSIVQSASENIYGAKILNQEAIGGSKLVVPPLNV